MTAKFGSLTKAAEVLKSSQPTVGRQVSALENSLKMALFERHGNKLILTPNGNEIFESIKEIQSLIDRARVISEANLNSMSGSVTVSVSQLDAIYRMPEILMKLTRYQPMLKLKILVSNDPTDLISREADIAIRYFRPNESNLIVRRVRDFEIYLYGNEEYKRHIDKNNSLPINIIGFENNERLIDIMEEHDYFVSRHNFIHSSNFQPLHIELAKLGLGCILLPQDIGDKMPGFSRISYNTKPLLSVNMWIVCHSDLRNSNKIKYVYDFLIAELS
ncbi:hypothetical protein ATY35_17890 [Vibrio cidicii]|uniref:HTH lysR-type domain-containing protein n=2 Tax=Vibrio cidicii TaxID=1763883 RepID=A0ABR5W2H7_9VIBR|nr:LysR family transcriptional regulator [Vibrio navarrensis]EJL6568083.1 LysR family transcriptional regulator [Vibrio navarrensis]KYN84661.1 hypothetical protein ATY35_17890 [Vibrio cidicii]